MNRAYWDRVADNYDDAVLSVFNHDTAGLVSSRLATAAAAHPGGTAADLGCGVGKFTPLLARAFNRVHACDLSPRGIAATRLRCDPFDNVRYWELDLASDPMPFAPVEFVLCVNLLIMPALDIRLRAWRTVTNQIAHGGTLLMVVPSVESVQYGYYRALETGLCAGNSCATSLRESAPTQGSLSDLHHGVHRLSGLRTKHYLREELEWMMPAHELDVVELVKLEYGPAGSTAENTGNTISANAARAQPAATVAPADGPVAWDWLVVARRR